MQQMMKRAVQGAWRTAMPRRLRNSLRLWLLLDMPDRAPRLITDFSEQNILVLAPHMDDEIIGPGGTLALHARSGSSISAIFMTDCTSGNPDDIPLDAGRTQKLAHQQVIAGARKEESRRAAEIIGIQSLHFLDGPDGALSATKSIVDALYAHLIALGSGIIYVPSLADNHRDHWATNLILSRALQRLPAPARARLTLRGYEIWSAAPINVMADITSTIEQKKEAMTQFQSQVKLVDYSWTTTGLNQYRAMMHLHGKGYAEGFLQLTTDEFAQLLRQIQIKRSAA